MSNEELSISIGKSIREGRLAKGWLVDEACSKLNLLLESESVPKSWWHNWELGINRPPLWKALAIAELLGVDPVELVDSTKPEWLFLSKRLSRYA